MPWSRTAYVALAAGDRAIEPLARDRGEARPLFVVWRCDLPQGRGALVGAGRVSHTALGLGGLSLGTERDRDGIVGAPNCVLQRTHGEEFDMGAHEGGF